MKRPAKSRRTKSESISSLISSLRKSSESAGRTAKCWFHISKSSLKCKLSTSISNVKFGAISTLTSNRMTRTLSKQNWKKLKKRKIRNGPNSTTHLEKRPIPSWPALKLKPRKLENRKKVASNHKILSKIVSQKCRHSLSLLHRVRQRHLQLQRNQQEVERPQEHHRLQQEVQELQLLLVVEVLPLQELVHLKRQGARHKQEDHQPEANHLPLPVWISLIWRWLTLVSLLSQLGCHVCQDVSRCKQLIRSWLRNSKWGNWRWLNNWRSNRKNLKKCQQVCHSKKVRRSWSRGLAMRVQV